VKTAYESRIFKNLNEFNLAKQCLHERQENLAELGNIICSHHLHEIVGIGLLHKHFDLEPGERLVEEFVGNSSYIKPCSEEECSDSIPYLWKAELAPGGDDWRYYPLEFANCSSAGVAQKAEAVMSNRDFLLEMTAKLDELELANTFGLALFHREAMKLDEGEILVEMTDEQNRILTCAPVAVEQMAQETLTQTLWQFSPSQTAHVVSQCYRHCIQHCFRHR